MHPRNKWLVLILMGVLFCGCAGAPTMPTSERVPYGPGSIVAVWDIEDLSPINAHEPDLGEFMAATIIEALEKRCKFKMVEREKLLLALEELALGSGELASENSRLQIGKILGAKLMVFGAYQLIGDVIRLDLRLVEVERGLVINAASSEANAKNLDARLKGAAVAAFELCAGSVE